MFDGMHIFVRMFVIHHRFTHLKKQMFEFNLSRLALLLRCDCCFHKFLCFFSISVQIFWFYSFFISNVATIQMFYIETFFHSFHGSLHFMDLLRSCDWQNGFFPHHSWKSAWKRERGRSVCACILQKYKLWSVVYLPIALIAHGKTEIEFTAACLWRYRAGARERVEQKQRVKEWGRESLR